LVTDLDPCHIDAHSPLALHRTLDVPEPEVLMLLSDPRQDDLSTGCSVRSTTVEKPLRLCYITNMGIRLAIGRALLFLAIAGLVLVPIARPVMAMPADLNASVGKGLAADPMASTTADDMACCPSKRSVPDCGKDCPFMALCTAAALIAAPQVALSVPITFASIVFPGDQTDLASIARAPPQRPPKA
jgi:hypothetical protein